MSNKSCPIQAACDQADHELHLEPCQEARCAWWTVRARQCAVVLPAGAIQVLSTRLGLRLLSRHRSRDGKMEVNHTD